MARKRIAPAGDDWAPSGGWKGAQAETQRETGETQRETGGSVVPVEEDGEIARYATAALKDLLTSDATGTAKASAARTLAEMAGAIGRHQQAPVDRAAETRVSLLRRDELERELERLRRETRG